MPNTAPRFCGDKRGLAATTDAFGVSRRRLFRWKVIFKAQGGNPAAMAPLVPSVQHAATSGLHHRPIQWPARPTRCAIRQRALNGWAAPTKTRKPKDLKAAPMTVWAVDTIERVRDELTITKTCSSPT